VQIVRIEEGMEIDSSDAQWANANSPNIDSLQPGSNVTSETNSHTRKQPLDIVSTEHGMQID
jgi:hypothetical protein